MSFRTAFARGLRAFAENLEEQAVAPYPYPASGGDMPDFATWFLSQPTSLSPALLSMPEVIRKVGIVRACVLRRANDLAMVPVVFEQQRGREWEPIERRPGNIVDVWNRANPAATAFEIVRDLGADFAGLGNAYLLMDWNGRKGGPPGEFWVLKAHAVTVIEGRRRAPLAYVFDRGERERVDADKVIHLRAYSPEDEPLGSSAVESVESAYKGKYDLMRVIAALMQSGGLPAGFLRPDVPAGATVQAMRPQDAEEVEKALNAKARRVDNWFRFRVLPGPLKFERQSLTPAELHLMEMGDKLDREICTALGVFPSMVGIGTLSGGTIGSAATVTTAERENYLDFTLMPDAALMAAVLTEKLCPRFGIGIRARFDFSAHPTMIDRTLRHGDALQKISGGPILVANEARKKLGEPPLQDPAADALRGVPEPFGGPEPAPEPEPKPAEPKPATVREARPVRFALAAAKKRHAVRLAQYERLFAAAFRDIFAAQRGRVEAALHEITRQARAPGDINAALEVDLEDREAVQALYERLVLARGLEAAAQVAADIELDIHDAAASAFVRADLDRVIRQTTDTTRKALRESLSDGIANRETLAELVARVGDVFENRRTNALTIARTETVRAYNWAATWAWGQAPEVEYVRWVTADDDAVRETHAAAEGQVRRLGDAFEVGEARLEFPGDPNGPAEETINCRCVLDPLDREDAEALGITLWWAGRNGHANGALPANRVRALLEARGATH